MEELIKTVGFSERTNKIILWGLPIMFKWTVGFLGCTFILFQILIRGFTYWVRTDSGAIQFYTVVEQDVELRKTPQNIRYLVIGDESKTPLLLIHGGFGGFRHWRNLAQGDDIYEKFHLIIPERPGYGPVQYTLAQSVSHEAGLLIDVIEDKMDVISFGVSYGAAPALQLTADYPDRFSGFVGGAGVYYSSREYHPTYWQFIPFTTERGRHLFPHVFSTAFIENRTKADYLQGLTKTIQSTNLPTILFHAQDDDIIPYKNSETFLNQIQSKKKKLYIITGIDHQFQERIPETITEKLLEFWSQLEVTKKTHRQ